MSCQTHIKKQNIPQLWNWLRDNEEQLFVKFKEQPQETTRQIKHYIRRINHLLTCEIYPGEKKHKLIISPNNVHELFDAVSDIVQQSPQLKYWEIIAFRPPQKLKEIEEINGEKYKIENFKVAVNKNAEEKLDLDIGVKNFEDYDYYKLLSAMFKILQKLLGEYNIEYHLGKVVLNNLDEKKHTIPLNELIAEFEK